MTHKENVWWCQIAENCCWEGRLWIAINSLVTRYKGSLTGSLIYQQGSSSLEKEKKLAGIYKSGKLHFVLWIYLIISQIHHDENKNLSYKKSFFNTASWHWETKIRLKERDVKISFWVDLGTTDELPLDTAYMRIRKSFDVTAGCFDGHLQLADPIYGNHLVTC